VLVSAVPFYLGQLFWLYPVANTLQKVIAVVMVAASLYTSWMFGTADLSMAYDVKSTVAMVMNMTAGYIVIVLGYILFDDGIKAHRLKKQAEGRAAQERDYQKIARAVLRELAETQRLQQETEREFGDPDLVRKQIDRLRGAKQKQQAQPFQPVMTNASNTEHVELSDNGSGPTRADGSSHNRPQK